MTDAVKSKDVEDVLASIRRLVSHKPKFTPDSLQVNGVDGAPEAVAPDISQPKGEDAREKLVLTSAQRIEDQAAAEVEQVPEAPFAQDVSSPKAADLPEVEALARRLLGADEERLRDLVVSEIRGALTSMEPEHEDAEEENLSFDAPEEATKPNSEIPGVDVPPAQGARGVLRLVSPVQPEAPNVPDYSVDPDKAGVASPTSAERGAQQIAPPATDTLDLSRFADPITPMEPVSPFLMSLYPSTESQKPSKSLEQKIAELEALIARSNTQFEPEQEGQGENAATTQPDAARIPWDEDLAEEPASAPATVPEAAETPSEVIYGSGDDTQTALEVAAAPVDTLEDPTVGAMEDADTLIFGRDEVVKEPADVDAVELTAVSKNPEPAELSPEPKPDASYAAKEAAPPTRDGAELAGETTSEALGGETSGSEEGDTPIQQDATPPVSEPPQLQLVAPPDTSADVLISEDELREMVARMIRDELQGVMGERITRNVRKLVRREIQRALANHDLD